MVATFTPVAGSHTRRWVFSYPLTSRPPSSTASPHTSPCVNSAVPTAVTNAAGFTPEILCGTLVKALRLISPEEEALSELSDTLPGNVAARHRVATALARCIKAAGLPGEVGYNQLLYPNEKDVRKLLSWAVGRLPRVDAGAGEGGGGRAATPAGALLRGLGAWLKPSSAGGGTPQSPPPGGAPMASQAALDVFQLRAEAAAAPSVPAKGAAIGLGAALAPKCSVSPLPPLAPKDAALELSASLQTLRTCPGT